MSKELLNTLFSSILGSRFSGVASSRISLLRV